MVKADWGTNATTAEPPHSPALVDPMALASSASMQAMQANAEKPPLDLSSPEPVLRARLTELVRREGNLWECGTTCPLKDMPDGNCTACPISRAHETNGDGTLDEERMSRLCRVGVEQERVSMLLLAKRHHGV